jgi:hypothetical protein
MIAGANTPRFKLTHSHLEDLQAAAREIVRRLDHHKGQSTQRA